MVSSNLNDRKLVDAPICTVRREYQDPVFRHLYMRPASKKLTNFTKTARLKVCSFVRKLTPSWVLLLRRDSFMSTYNLLLLEKIEHGAFYLSDIKKHERLPFSTSVTKNTRYHGNEFVYQKNLHMNLANFKVPML